MNGMNENPMESYSIASRCVCDKCHVQPNIKSATGTAFITMTVECHGETETKTIEKKELVFTQHFFKQADNGN